MAYVLHGYLCWSVTNSPYGRREIAFAISLRLRRLRSGMEIIMEKQEQGIRKVWHFLRPTVIGASVVLVIFFALQGIPMNQTLDRRTDIKAVKVTQNGVERILTDEEEMRSAAEVAGMLARRFPTEQKAEPDTCYVFTFQDGSELTVGSYENDIYYNGKWYTGAASTPELFKRVTGSRFFVIEAPQE